MCPCVTSISVFSLCCGRLGALQGGGSHSTSKLTCECVHDSVCGAYTEECILARASKMGRRTLNSLGDINVLAFKITQAICIGILLE